MPQRAHATGEARALGALLFVCAAPWPRAVVGHSNAVQMAARRGGGGRGKKARSAKRPAPRRAPSPSPRSSPDLSAASDAPAASSADIASAVDATGASAASVDSAAAAAAAAPAVTQGAEALVEPPAAAESAVFKLPEEPLATRDMRRRRRRRRAASTGGGLDVGGAEAEADSGPLPEAEISRLTSAYRTGAPGRAELVERIELDPNYMFRGGNAEGEYGLTAAIIGTGRPNKQGVYVTPYLQSSHVILLLVILLGTFVYYPGFPLTEGSEELRAILRVALATVYVANLGLAVYSYAEAKKRGQPPLFWFFKVALLGNIALQELRGNAPVTEVANGTRRKGKR